MRETLTYTKRATFKDCHRKYYYRFELGLKKKAEAPARRRGHAFGSALYAARNAQEDIKSVIEAAVADAYDDAYDEATSQQEIDEIRIEEAKVVVMAIKYIERYGIDLRRELVYRAPLIYPSTGGMSRVFELGGKIDGMRIIGPRHALIIEDKFVSQIVRARIDTLAMDEQIAEYVDALNRLDWTADVSYRHTRLPGINPMKEKILKTKTHPAETIDEFRERLTADVASRMDYYFDEQYLVFPPDSLREFQADRENTARDIIRFRRERTWYRSTQRCTDWGGCEFIPICAGFPDAMDLYKQSQVDEELRTDGEA